nr:MAG TPA: hypothetical protein [Caudoviricetes sp.]
MQTMREPLETLGKRQNNNDWENRAQRVRVPYHPCMPRGMGNSF